MYQYPSTQHTHYALKQLSDFFDAYGFTGSLQYTCLLLSSALHHKAWQHPEPYSIIRFCQQLRQLVSTAFTLADDAEPTVQCSVPLGEHGHPDTSLTHHYVGTYKPATAWQYFPRHLNPLQYSEPMQVIKEFTRYRSLEEWQQLLDDLLEYSLSNRSIHGSLPAGIGYMKMRELLLQLVEASHLVAVRTIDYSPAFHCTGGS